MSGIGFGYLCKKILAMDDEKNENRLGSCADCVVPGLWLFAAGVEILCELQ